MEFGLQPLHLVVVLVIGLIVFGPRRLPEIGRGLARAINEFKKGAHEFSEGFREDADSPSGGVSAAARSPNQPVGQVISPTRQYCIFCGAPNPSDARFCNQCGKQLPV